MKGTQKFWLLLYISAAFAALAVQAYIFSEKYGGGNDKTSREVQSVEFLVQVVFGSCSLAAVVMAIKAIWRPRVAQAARQERLVYGLFAIGLTMYLLVMWHVS